MNTPVLFLYVSASPIISQQIHSCVPQVSLTPYLNFKNPANYLSARVSFTAIKKPVLPLSPTVHILVLPLSNFGNQRMGGAKVVWPTKVAGRFHSDPAADASGCVQLAVVLVHFCQEHCLRAVLNAKPTRASEFAEIPFFWEWTF